MGLLKNKKFIIVLGSLVLLAAILLSGYKVFSIYSFNKFTKELDGGNTSLFTAFKAEIGTGDKIMGNIAKSSDLGVGFSKERNTGYSDQANKEYKDALGDYKKGLDEMESRSKDITSFGNLPLWLSADQIKFVNEINIFFEEYPKIRKADYEFQVKTQPIFNNYIQVLNDTSSIVDYSMKFSASAAVAPQTPEGVAKAANDNLSYLSSLEKYTKEDFKFEGQDKLATEFPKTYKELTQIKGIFGQIYSLFQAFAKGDFSQISEIDKISDAANQLSESSSSSSVEIAEKAKPNTVKFKDSYMKFAKALDFFNEEKLSSNLLSKEKVLVQNNQNKLVVFNYIVALYSVENSSKYPTDTTFSSLITTLKSGNHFDKSLKYVESDFTYSSDGLRYYELGYKNEISGETEKIAFGVKDDSTTTLGVSIPDWNIKVGDKQINLEFVNKLINNSSILCNPASFCSLRN